MKEILVRPMLVRLSIQAQSYLYKLAYISSMKERRPMRRIPESFVCTRKPGLIKCAKSGKKGNMV